MNFQITPMSRTLYCFVLYLLSPILYFKLLLRISKDRQYLDRLSQRFGYGLNRSELTQKDHQPRIWIHAVSVGEVNAAIPLVNRICEKYPDFVIVLTTMTPTGAKQANDYLSDKIRHCYLPYDFPGSVKRFVSSIQPAMAIFMETEIWPNYLAFCSKKRIPIIFANTRLSEKSYRRYRNFKRLISTSLSYVDEFAIQAQMDAGRLMKLGARKESIHITGNIKFDITISDKMKQAALHLRYCLGNQRPIWIAGSTHPQEEQQILDASSEIKKKCMDVLLILVPRHPERSSEILNKCMKNGFKTLLHSKLQNALSNDIDIIIGDSMGELPMMIASSDVAFIGGSLVPVGGHNVLEASAVGVPVIFGPHMFNFQKISDQILAYGAGLQVENASELAETISKLLNDPTLRENYGELGQRFVDENRGAVERVFALIEKHILKIGGLTCITS
ncbi:MAG: lipid IV(A) 3-deoxy-D-manno-octulosonic acid transferase [Gammaproteobacteria bacterium]|nr:lipid IV(A) 3-deoxy-D-manno-octulosonic acid transferase [Gammaproteobacteria bacterium]MCY4274757.1 lipid IV(A) 3-deoxy-D-manno-octulosonic acid transferase [Gammaproteobacteria bacterium]